MTRTIPDEVLHVAAGVALEVRRRYAAYVDLDDLQGEAALWAVSNPGKVREYMKLDEREMRAVVATSIRNRLRRYAERVKAERLGYSVRDVVFYDAAQVREELLPALFDREAWSNPPKPDRDEVRAKQDPAHGGNWMASLADVADAYRRLSEEDRLLVSMRFREEMKYGDIADELGVSDATVSDRLDRVVDRIVTLLGGERPEHEEDELTIGRRRVVSNSHAQAVTRSGYDGE